MNSKELTNAIRGLQEGQESRCGALNALRIYGLPIILHLAEEAQIRQIAREAESHKAMDKAIERAVKRSDEEMQGSPAISEGESPPEELKEDVADGERSDPWTPRKPEARPIRPSDHPEHPA